MSTQDSPEVIELDVPKHEISFTLEDFLNPLIEKPRLLTQAAAGASLLPDLHPDISQHLQRISELAAELKAEIGLINQIDPDALNRLKQA
jgi:hypothetical protein